MKIKIPSYDKCRIKNQGFIKNEKTLKCIMILAGVLQLLTAIFLLFITGLALADATEIENKVRKDIEDSQDLDCCGEILLKRLNAIRMDEAHRNATKSINTLYCMLVFHLLRLVLSSLLICGIFINKRSSMYVLLITILIVMFARMIPLFYILDPNYNPSVSLGIITEDYRDSKSGVIFLLAFMVWTYLVPFCMIYVYYRKLGDSSQLIHTVHENKRKLSVIPIYERVQLGNLIASSTKPLDI